MRVSHWVKLVDWVIRPRDLLEDLVLLTSPLPQVMGHTSSEEFGEGRNKPLASLSSLLLPREGQGKVSHRDGD